MRFADPRTGPPTCTAVTADGLWLVPMEESTFILPYTATRRQQSQGRRVLS